LAWYIGDAEQAGTPMTVSVEAASLNGSPFLRYFDWR